MNTSKPTLSGRLLAEFLIVVLGVIVALGVDEWRRAQAERAEESSYYNRLAEDFAADTTSWSLVIDLLEPKEAALQRVEEWLSAPSTSEEGVLRRLANDLAMGAVFSGSIPPPRRSTYTELLSTGKLEILQDEPFRAELIDYHFNFENLEQRFSSRVTGYEAMAYSLVPREIRETGDNFANPDLSFAELRSLAERAVELDLKPLVVAERNRTRFLRQLVGTLLEGARALHTNVRDNLT